MTNKENSTQEIKLSKNELDCLQHMLGARPDIPKKQRGLRNRFCVGIDTPNADYKAMLRLEELGLVVAGQKINQGKDQLFFATEAGCKFVGLTAEQTKYALGS